MKWDNIFKILKNYTQYKHYQLLCDKFDVPKKNSRDDMANMLYEIFEDAGFLDPIISQREFEDWLALHQIDGNNYTFVYNLETMIEKELLENIYINRDNYIGLKIWEINPDNESENLSIVMPNLTKIILTGIHYNPSEESYTFSYLSPCQVSGTKIDGSSRIYKKMFFAHCVVYKDRSDCKVIFNPTTNLLNVNGTKKEKKSNWSPIADMFFDKTKDYIGETYITAPNWIPNALYKFAEEVTSHKNPQITRSSFKAQKTIENFAKDLLNSSGIDIDNENALLERFKQDIQYSFESQLVEKFGPNEDEEDFTVFKQRSDGLTHIINVESTQDGFKSGSAAQAAKRSRQDGDLDLLGITLKYKGSIHKFLVEQGKDAYLIKGSNTFLEEEVVNVVIHRLNEYREQIQSATFSNTGSSKGAAGIKAK